MDGQIDENTFFPDTEEGRAAKAQAVHETQEIQKRMSPPGALGLPAYLDQRRLQYGIPDTAFTSEASFDRILIFQIPMYSSTHYGTSGLIVMPDQGKKRTYEEAPRGIVISAGLRAMDVMISNGMLLGDIIHFVRQAPFRMPYDIINGKEQYLIVGMVGDIVSSEDVRERMKSREARVVVKDIDGVPAHRLVNSDGKAWTPLEPWIAEDY